MVKSKAKVNKKAGIIVMVILILFGISSNQIYAVIPRENNLEVMQEDPGYSGSNRIENSNRNLYLNILRFIYKKGSGNNSQPITTITPSNNNSQYSTPLEMNPTELVNYPTPATINGFKVFRQCNYRNVTAVQNCSGGSKSLCNMGCGITSVAMVLSTLLNTTIDPPQVLQQYRTNKAYIGCDGTNIADAKKIIDSFKSQGLTTSSTYLFNYGHSNAATIDQVAFHIRQKVKNGWYVFALTDFCQGGCAHYHIITDIDDNNIVTSYDPYYEPPETSRQPINYTSHYPFPKYRTAFAIRKN